MIAGAGAALSQLGTYMRVRTVAFPITLTIFNPIDAVLYLISRPDVSRPEHDRSIRTKIYNYDMVLP